MKPLTKTDIEKYASYLNEKIVGRHISSPILYTDKVVFFRLSGQPYSRLAIVLDEDAPRIYMAPEGVGVTSLSSHFFDQLKKEMVNPYIESVEAFGNDRILKISMLVINNVFKEEKRHLYLEMFPHHANLILTDSENKITLAYKSGHLGEDRPMLRGLIYEAPKGNDFVAKPSTFDASIYEKECLSAEEILANKRKSDRFSYLIKSLKNRKKLLERKLISLDNDIESAKEHLDDGRFGDAIYMCFDEIEPKASSFVYEGEEIKLDPSKNAAMNANQYYKKAKKAKMTMVQAELNKEKAKKEIEDVSLSLTQLEHADEAGLELLAKDLDIAIVNQSKKKHNDKWNGLSSASLPFFVEYEGTKILYGKNQKQNDCLTFLFETAKEHLWLHIMGNSGSHVIIKKDNPTEDEIRVAAEVALINSHQEEGEVMIAYRKDVRKGNVPGQAIVKTFRTYRLNNVSKTTKQLVEAARKYTF